MNDEETKPLLEERGIVRDATLGSEGTPEDTPDDKWNLAYIIFFVLVGDATCRLSPLKPLVLPCFRACFCLQGIGMLFPWNMFITASSFFKYAPLFEAQHLTLTSVPSPSPLSPPATASQASRSPPTASPSSPLAFRYAPTAVALR